MNQTLRDFIRAREAEVKQQIATLRSELDQLRVAKAAIDGDAPAAQSPKVTHRSMVREALDEHPEGGTSEQVIAWVREKYGVEISRTSISSHLSRIKSEERGAILDNSTKVWRSVKHVYPDAEVRDMLGYTAPENDAPDEGASEADAEDAATSPASNS